MIMYISTNTFANMNVKSYITLAESNNYFIQFFSNMVVFNTNHILTVLMMLRMCRYQKSLMKIKE